MSGIVEWIASAGMVVCILGVIAIVIYLLSWLFWLFMFIDSLHKENKGWAILLLLSVITGFPGLVAILYFFIGRKEK